MIVAVGGVAAGAAAALFAIGRRAGRGVAPDAPDRFVQMQRRYQPRAVAVAGLAAAAALALGGAPARDLLAWGRLDAPAGRIALFGVNEGEAWSRVALSGGAVIVSVTGGYLVLGLRAGRMRISWSQLPRLAPAIVGFAATNALAEELIFRFGIVAPLNGRHSTSTIAFLSAGAFGLAHWRGMPGGAVGVVMSAVLGYFLARATLETYGLGVAWAIHFVLDVLIMGTAALATNRAPAVAKPGT